MIQVNKVFESLSGNPGLTEQFIYNNILNDGVKYQVLSSSTSDITQMGTISMCITEKGKKLAVFEDRQGILIARNGKAGQMRYLNKGKYTINDHAYILSLKKSFKKKYNIDCEIKEENFLKYFIFRYQHDVYSYSSKNDNATWNKTAFMNNLFIEIPDQSIINNIASKYDQIISYRDFLQQKINHLNSLLDRTII